jgi:hypothetical protein
MRETNEVRSARELARIKAVAKLAADADVHLRSALGRVLEASSVEDASDAIRGDARTFAQAVIVLLQQV